MIEWVWGRANSSNVLFLMTEPPSVCYFQKGCLRWRQNWRRRGHDETTRYQSAVVSFFSKRLSIFALICEFVNAICSRQMMIDHHHQDNDTNKNRNKRSTESYVPYSHCIGVWCLGTGQNKKGIDFENIKNKLTRKIHTINNVSVALCWTHTFDLRATEFHHLIPLFSCSLHRLCKTMQVHRANCRIKSVFRSITLMFLPRFICSLSFN